MGPHPKLLLIDDNEGFRAAMGARLMAEGFAVTAVASGQEGLQAVATERFDLVLLDMLMPEKDGIATYQELRANPSTRQTPIILLTGVAVEGHWEPMPYNTDGQAYILGKPYDYRVLLTRIHQVLTQAVGGV